MHTIKFTFSKEVGREVTILIRVFPRPIINGKMCFTIVGNYLRETNSINKLKSWFPINQILSFEQEYFRNRVEFEISLKNPYLYIYTYDISVKIRGQ